MKKENQFKNTLHYTLKSTNFNNLEYRFSVQNLNKNKNNVTAFDKKANHRSDKGLILFNTRDLH
jgi:hypothetical protein